MSISRNFWRTEFKVPSGLQTYQFRLLKNRFQLTIRKITLVQVRRSTLASYQQKFRPHKRGAEAVQWSFSLKLWKRCEKINGWCFLWNSSSSSSTFKVVSKDSSEVYDIKNEAFETNDFDPFVQEVDLILGMKDVLETIG